MTAISQSPPDTEEPVAPPGGRPSGRRPGGHLGAVDVVRFVTVAGVILTHATGLTGSRTDLVTGGVLALTHVTRSVFLLLSAFVLTYSFQRRPLPPRAFWRRRYPLVVAPYVVWSAVYVATDGELHRGPAWVVGHFLLDLTDGGAHYHLYFLMLTFQLYLVFPALIAWLGRRPGLHRPLLVASAAFQVLFSAAIHYGWRPPVLRIWLEHTGTWLPSYQLYVLAGILAALHFDALTAWTRAHTRLIVGALVASVALGQASYVLDLSFLHYDALKAGEVFQPTVTLEVVTVSFAQYALGIWVADRASARRRRFLERSADVSFGVYLAHPLLLGGILDLAAVTGLTGVAGRWPHGVIEALVAVGLVPVVYAITFWAVTLIRRTPASMWLTGRRGPRPVRAPLATPAPSVPVV